MIESTWAAVTSNLSFFDLAAPRQKRKTGTSSAVEPQHYEACHQIICNAICIVGQRKFTWHSNREFELGRPDLLLSPRNSQSRVVVVEFNVASTNNLGAEAERAIKQIYDRKYAEAAVNPLFNSNFKEAVLLA